jgi:hypothetical protein
VSETVPLIEEMEHAMLDIRDDKLLGVTHHGVTRLAAQAALVVIAKYYALTDDCEIYRIAISKCSSLLFHCSAVKNFV